jgi:UDP-N-acetyl-D-glucosamine dehydrogenase
VAATEPDSLAPFPSDNWPERIARREIKVGIIGLGYVGLPLALLFSESGLPVTGFDIDEEKIRQLNAGESYIQRIPPQQVRTALASGFHSTTDFSEIARMDAILLCVPTPLNDNRTPDMSYITSTAESIAPWLRDGQLVVLESTTYPGTTEEVLAPLLESHPANGIRVARRSDQVPGGVLVAYSPEREDPGNKKIDRRNVPKVVGGMEPRAAVAAEALYRTVFHSVVQVSTPATAEMTKLLENIYRCVNIALVNELKLLSERMGIDIWEVIQAASTKPFGFQPFYPGPGLGGHCIPIDPFYLSWKAKEFNFETRFIELAGEINESMPSHVVQTVVNALNRRGKALNGARVLVLGLAYKRDVDDLRESPSLTIITSMQQQGALVEYNDPYFPTVGQGRHYTLNMRSVPLENLSVYDCVVIVTDHSSYDYKKIVDDSNLVIDSRNATHGLTSAKIVRC